MLHVYRSSRPPKWVDGGVRPSQERQQLVDLGRLLELGVDQGEDVEGVPGENEENRDEYENPGKTKDLYLDGHKPRP